MSQEQESELDTDQATATEDRDQEPEQPARGEFKAFRGRKPILKRIYEEQHDVYERMLQFIRAGAWDYQVAQAMGIDPDTFGRWMKRGRTAKKGVFRRFYRDVIQARSQSRIMAEVQVRREDPKFWLTHGPGKTRPDQPGWTDTVVITGDADMPLEHRHQHEGQVNVNVAQSPPQELAASLAILQQLGIFNIDPATGQPAIRGISGRPMMIDGQVQMVADDEDEAYDEDENETKDKGYIPDADVSIDDIPTKPPRRG
jgi:hypothetical protein